MKLSTRSRYGTRLMLDLAIHYGQGSIMLKDIAKRQAVSLKYLSQIIIPLKGAGMVLSVRGAHGGYTLAKTPEMVTLREIVETLEGDTSILDCVHESASCKRSGSCVMRDVWCRLDGTIASFLEGITLRTLVDNSRKYEKNDTKYHAMTF
ncbi:MAG: Rrf2 family transcriptional regulator [Spirochaetes bacterium]|nr:Rrf2 family transcriptional regulator [Spirochaetota bacterium]